MAAKILARTEHLVLRHLTNDKSQIRRGAPEVRTRRCHPEGFEPPTF